MQFQVQGQNYFLKFDPGAGRWYLLKPTLGGFTGMAVLDDDPRPTGSDMIPEAQEEQEIVH
jgi:hypothetical protein